jgi:hypothetical protein
MPSHGPLAYGDDQADAANESITDALRIPESGPGPGDEGDDDSEQAS